MASEKGAMQLMNMLDKAVEEISKIDGRLSLYEKRLSVSEMKRKFFEKMTNFYCTDGC